MLAEMTLYFSATTEFSSTPILSISTRTRSPGRSQRGGFGAPPIPAGVSAERQ